MKQLILIALVFGFVACAQKPVLKATELQLMKYQRDQARLIALQVQAQPMMDELKKLQAEVCDAAKIPNCNVNWETGEVTPAPAQPKK